MLCFQACGLSYKEIWTHFGDCGIQMGEYTELVERLALFVHFEKNFNGVIAQEKINHYLFESKMSEKVTNFEGEDCIVDEGQLSYTFE